MNAKMSRVSFLFPLFSLGCGNWWPSGCPDYCPRGGNDPACNLDKCSCSFEQKGDGNHVCCVQAGGECHVPADSPSECAAEVSQSSPVVKIIPQLTAQRDGDGSTNIAICDPVEYTWGYFNAMAGTLEPPEAGLSPIFTLWEYGHEKTILLRPWGQTAACATDGQVVATNLFADPETSVSPVTFNAELIQLPPSSEPQFVSIRADVLSDLSNCNGPLQIGDDFDDFE